MAFGHKGKAELTSLATRLSMNSKLGCTDTLYYMHCRNRKCATRILLLVYMLFVLLLYQYIRSAAWLTQALDVLSWLKELSISDIDNVPSIS